MARIRTVKPEFWTAEQVMECSPLARLMFIGMWNFCDDNGVMPASAKTVKAQIFPSDDILTADVEGFVSELIGQGLLGLFEADGRRWWFVTGWKRHQLINRPSKSRYPSPPHCHMPQPEAAGQGDSVSDADQLSESNTDEGLDSIADSVSSNGTFTDDSVNTHGGLSEDSLTEVEGNRKGIGRGKDGSSSSSLNPTPREQAPPRPPLSEPSAQVQRIGYVCRLLRDKGVNCSPAQLQGKYRGLEDSSDDDFHLAVQTLRDRGQLRINLGLVAAVIGDLIEARQHRPGAPPTPAAGAGRRGEKFNPTLYVNDPTYRARWDAANGNDNGAGNGNEPIDVTPQRVA
ncbi:hypothetical protein [Chromobacterium haemolyticum]|uniref:hypothetical protein n=1 Tax=Chromobacterium haemolyticum TaxID=394935 RepID=UPI00307F7512